MALAGFAPVTLSAPALTACGGATETSAKDAAADTSIVNGEAAVADASGASLLDDTGNQGADARSDSPSDDAGADATEARCSGTTPSCGGGLCLCTWDEMIARFEDAGCRPIELATCSGGFNDFPIVGEDLARACFYAADGGQFVASAEGTPIPGVGPFVACIGPASFLQTLGTCARFTYPCVTDAGGD
jgi:hypothetical protein